MKYSQFNSIVTIGESIYLFNAFTQKFMIIEPLLNDLLEAAKVEGIDGLEQIHPTFYDYLKTEKYLVSEELDEVEEVKKISKAVDENQSTFLLTVNPTMNCNFKCWYCYETHIRKSAISPGMIDKVGKFISKTTAKQNINNFFISFFGGEPLLYFKRDVMPIITKMQEECIKNRVDYGVSFTTNGYLVDQNMIDFFKTTGIRPSFQITLDGYGEKHDKVRYVNANKGSYDVIVKNIKLLINNHFHIRLRINYTEENLSDAHRIADDFLDIAPELKRKYLTIDFHRVWQDSKADDIRKEVEEITGQIRDKGIPVWHMNLNNVKESCYADKRNSAVINYNGDLFKCTARDFTTEKRAGFLDDDGNLNWEDNYLERRMDVKFKNKPCLSCRLLPICNGGCSQHAMEAIEHNREYCVYYGEDRIKDDAVRSKIEAMIDVLKSNEVPVS